MSDDLLQPSGQLFQEIRQLIDAAKQRAALAINAELTLLYWQVGKRIKVEVLKDKRAEYGKQIINNLSTRLTQNYGRGWSEKQLRHCLHFATTFSDESIVSALRRQLSWTHIKTLMHVSDTTRSNCFRSPSPQRSRRRLRLIRLRFCAYRVQNLTNAPK